MAGTADTAAGQEGTVSQDPQAGLTAELARDMLAELAPHELPLFQPISQAYFDDPDRVAAGSDRDEMLGFGAAGAEVLLTPALLAVVSQVVAFLLDQVKENASKEGATLAGEWVRWVFGRARPPAASAVAGAAAAASLPAGLTASQITRVRELVVKRATELKVAPAKAELLADAVAGKLAVAPA
jgi:hypothetical protein